MTNSKHTPGNWLALQSAGETDWIVADSGARPGLGMPIARIENYHGQAQANAALIASAPDLLRQVGELKAALKSLEASATKMLAGGFSAMGDMHSAIGDATRQARAALANAEKVGMEAASSQNREHQLEQALKYLVSQVEGWAMAKNESLPDGTYQAKALIQ